MPRNAKLVSPIRGEVVGNGVPENDKAMSPSQCLIST